MTTADQAVVEVVGLCAGYGSLPVLREVTLKARPGEILGILGHNGMGKTTLMKALIGLLPTTAGRIALDGVDISAAPAHVRARAGLAYVPQGREIFAALTVRENILFGSGRPSAIDRAIADFPILGQLLNRRGGTLSGGEQQILAFARALAPNPRILLLDEPTEGIAPSVVEEIEDHLRRLASTGSLAVIVVEQDLDFIGAVASRALMINRGEIVREMSPAALRDQAAAEEFFGVTS
jgi:branched-chain amino acid transport system ATP-binding protein